MSVMRGVAVMQSSYLRMTRSQTVMTKRRFRNPSSHDLKKQFEKFQGQKVTQSKECQEILARTRVITESSEARRVVDRLMEQGRPLGVDMEAVNCDRTGLVQVSDTDSNISLFRTGINPDLFWGGGLAELLESPSVLKILHAATVDAQSVYKDGVRMWNIFDTSVAFKVLNFQRHGLAMHCGQQIGFNNLCLHYELPENPLKDMFKNILWKMEMSQDMELGYMAQAELEPEFVVYAAWDVAPLHRLHSLLTEDLSPDYRHLVTQLSELELLRCMDPELLKVKKTNLKGMETVTMFLSNLPESTFPPALYLALGAHTSGYKHVYTSPRDRTAHVILSSREEVIQMSKNLAKWQTPGMAESGTQCALVVEAKEYEDAEDLEEGDIAMELMPELDSYNAVSVNISGDAEMCLKITRGLVEAKVPVVTEFSYFKAPGEERVAMVLYTGRAPSYRLTVTQEMLHEGGLGEMLASDCPKVMLRTDTEACHAAFKYFSLNNVAINNIIDLNLAVKALDYYEYGQSWFQQKSMKSGALLKFLGIDLDRKVAQEHRLYVTWLELEDSLPPQAMKILEEHTQYEVTIAAQNQHSLKAKYKKNELKRIVDQVTVHIRLHGKRNKISKSAQEKIRDMVSTFSAHEDMDPEFQFVGRCCVISVKHKHKIPDLLTHLDENKGLSLQRSGLSYTLSCPRYFKDVLEKALRKPNTQKLAEKLKNNTFKLQRAGVQQTKVELQDEFDDERIDQSLGLVNKVKNLF